MCELYLGKCRTVDIQHEGKVLINILKTVKTSGFTETDVPKNAILDIVNANDRYNTQVLDYVFEKYMIKRNDTQCGTIKYRYVLKFV